MSDRFSDEKFIEAARTYQSIKAPSDLREKVLMAADEQCGAGKRTPSDGVLQMQTAAKRRRPVKLHRAAALAACVAIAVAILPGQIGEHPAETDFTQPADTQQMLRMMPEPAEEDREGEPVMASEPVMPEKNVEENKLPEKADGTSAGGKNVSKPDTVSEEESKPQTEDWEPVTETAAEAPSISLGQLLPAMLSVSTSLNEMEVRILESEDGSCKVEVTTADHKTAEVTLSRNEEDGHWEFHGPDESAS